MINPGRVLVVDDESVSRTLMTTSLQQEGHLVAEAEDGSVALNRLQNEPYDVVILDLTRPHIDGFTVLERMRASQRLRHTPVIVVSGTTELKDVIRCLSAGATDYLPRPVDSFLLVTRVAAALRTKRQRDREVYYLQSLHVQPMLSTSWLDARMSSGPWLGPYSRQGRAAKPNARLRIAS